MSLDERNAHSRAGKSPGERGAGLAGPDDNGIEMVTHGNSTTMRMNGSGDRHDIFNNRGAAILGEIWNGPGLISRFLFGAVLRTPPSAGPKVSGRGLGIESVGRPGGKVGRPCHNRS